MLALMASKRASFAGAFVFHWIHAVGDVFGDWNHLLLEVATAACFAARILDFQSKCVVWTLVNHPVFLGGPPAARLYISYRPDTFYRRAAVERPGNIRRIPREHF